MGKLYRAFTLLELLVVLVIIGIVIAAASLMLSNSGRDQQNLKTAINLFTSRMVLAQQQAVLGTNTLGVSISARGYQFYRYVEISPSHNWTWQTFTKTNVLGYQAWPKNSEIALQAGQQPGALLGDVFPPQPQIIFYPSNQITPFKLIADNKYEVIGSVAGQISASTGHA